MSGHVDALAVELHTFHFEPHALLLARLEPELDLAAGAECRVRNPWTGEVQRFPTRKGQKITLRKA